MAFRRRFYSKQESGNFPGFPTYVEKSSHPGRKLLLFIIVFAVVAAVALGGLYFLGQSRGTKLPFLAKTTPTPTKTKMIPTDTPTPTPSLSRSSITVSVLNGSGKAGAAGSMADYLKGLGYNVTKTGNADRFDYTQTTLEVSQDKKQYLPLLKDDLGKQNSGAVSATVSAKLSTDAVVIVGK